MAGGNACSTIRFHWGFQVVSPNSAAFLSIGVDGTCLTGGFGGTVCCSRVAHPPNTVPTQRITAYIFSSEIYTHHHPLIKKGRRHLCSRPGCLDALNRNPVATFAMQPRDSIFTAASFAKKQLLDRQNNVVT